MNDLKYCPEHEPASVMYRSEGCPMCTLENEARRAQAGWVKEIENHRRTTLKLIEAMK